MPRIRLSLFLPVIALVLTACPVGVEDPDATPENDATSTPAPSPPEPPEVAVCLQREPFIQDGTFPLEATEDGDAHELGELRWAAHEGCERFVIDLLGEDGTEAASVGEAEAEVIRGLGIVRITLPGVESVEQEATDASFDGPLAGVAYVVAVEEGPWHQVDLHLAEEAEAHVALFEDPARVVVDLRPGGTALPPAPATEEDLVVILDPRPEEERAYPLTVTGYARTFEANVVVRIEQDGEQVLEDNTLATSWVDAWGLYELTIEEGPTGAIEVHVGEYSARDGTWQGTLVEVTMG